MSDLVERLNNGIACFKATTLDGGSVPNFIATIEMQKEAATEITRLRAALADAQAVGFAAGVEAAAKSVKRHSDIARGKMSACYDQHDANSLREWSAIVSHLDIERDAIRALTPPDAAAAAARVLLDDLALALSTEIGVAGGKEAGRRWSTATTAMSRATPIRMIRAALRAIAGDTP